MDPCGTPDRTVCQAETSHRNNSSMATVRQVTTKSPVQVAINANRVQLSQQTIIELSLTKLSSYVNTKQG